MDTNELITQLHHMARHCVSVDHVENEALKEAAYLLDTMTGPARLLTWEMFEALPDGAVVWEECRGEIAPMGIYDDIAPVYKIGDMLCGNGITTRVSEDMMIREYENRYIRWWTARPTQEMMEETLWRIRV